MFQEDCRYRPDFLAPYSSATTLRSLRAASSSECFAHHLVQAPTIRDALQFVLPAVLEGESRAGDQVLHRIRDEHLARSCQRRHAGTDVDGDPPDGVALELDLTCVKPDADVEAEILHRVSDCHGASDGSGWPIEGRKEPIARRIHLAAAVPSQQSPDSLVVGDQELSPRPIAHLGSAL